MQNPTIKRATPAEAGSGREAHRSQNSPYCTSTEDTLEILALKVAQASPVPPANVDQEQHGILRN